MSPQSDQLDALALAAQSHDFDGILYLVRQGASPDSPLGDATLLTWAVRQGQAGLAQSLVEARANPDLGDAEGDTPLMHAARHGLQEIVEFLVEAGADPLARNRAGKTAREAALAARTELTKEINDPNADQSSLESLFGRYGRIVTMLDDAEKNRAEENRTRAREIAAFHTGSAGTVTILSPIKFAKPGGAP